MSPRFIARGQALLDQPASGPFLPHPNGIAPTSPGLCPRRYPGSPHHPASALKELRRTPRTTITSGVEFNAHFAQDPETQR